MIPTPWVSLVLALAAFRVVRLLGWDDFPPIERLRARATGENTAHRGESLYGNDVWYTRPLLRKFLFCPWCVGFWVACAVYVAWLELPTWTVYAAAPFALSAFVGLVAKNLDP